MSGDAEALAAAMLPAYALGLSIQESEPLGMNDPGAWLETATLTVSVYQRGGLGIDATLRALADSLNTAVLAAPRDLGDLVEWIRPGDQEPEIARGEKRVARLDLSFSLQFINRT